MPDYRAIFIEAHGPGPWPCAYDGCGLLVHDIGGNTGFVHHIDENRSNNDPSNLAAMHPACHVRHHRAGRPGNRRGAKLTPEQVARMSEIRRGKPAAHGYTPEVRAAMSAAHLGKPHTEKQYTCECGRTMHAGPLRRHQNATNHKTKELPDATTV